MSKRDYNIAGLCTAIERSRQALVPFREKRKAAVDEYVGDQWGEGGVDHPVPVNLLALYLSVVARNLISKAPRVSLSTFERAHKPKVRAMQEWCNKETEVLGLADTLQRAVIDGLFSIGIVKVGLATAAEAGLSGWEVGAGQPFVDIIDLDDFAYDIHARDFREAGFIGHRYRVPLRIVQESKLYHKSRKDLQASDDSAYNEQGDERINTLGRGSALDSDEYEPMVDLWEIYLPRERAIITLSDYQMGSVAQGTEGVKPLREQAWIGPYCGPYHFLGFGVVPGNAMPKAPLQDLLELHLNTNSLFRKLNRQAQNQKTVIAYASHAAEDANRISRADDMEMVKVNDPKAVVPMPFNGADPQGYVTADAFNQLFSRMAGNLDMMGGLSPQSKTLGQDKLLSENASRAIVDMQERTMAFTAKVYKALCWYWWNDPFKTMKTKFSLPGMPEISVPRRVTPEDRQQVPFEDITIQVSPYSAKTKSPEERMAMLDQLMTQVLIPMAPLIQQQGISLDMNAYLRMKQEYMDMPDLSDLVTTQDPPVTDTKMGGEAQKPGQTERKYVRENVSTRTQEGDNSNLRNRMIGMNPGGARNGNGKVPGGL